MVHGLLGREHDQRGGVYEQAAGGSVRLEARLCFQPNDTCGLPHEVGGYNIGADSFLLAQTVLVETVTPCPLKEMLNLREDTTTKCDRAAAPQAQEDSFALQRCCPVVHNGLHSAICPQIALLEDLAHYLPFRKREPEDDPGRNRSQIRSELSEEYSGPEE
ncbi:hypothetical protein EYF80_006481 [Liparis tanakae]|uniref:Uncharacterized protein n=1 Tax=Liparis tanakae TaxID=230148 RepID=A0A4Z2IZQ8_9TELE|nr:hypothetical protein EYF80_006481 [Liparis tanakae]